MELKRQSFDLSIFPQAISKNVSSFKKLRFISTFFFYVHSSAKGFNSTSDLLSIDCGCLSIYEKFKRENMYKTYIIRRNIVLDKRFYTSRFIIFMKFLLICYSSYIQDHTITILVNENNTFFIRILNISESHFLVPLLLKIIYYFIETFSKSVYIFYYIHIG